MVKRLAAPVWPRLPIAFRQWLVRASQVTFTVGVSAVLLNDAGEVLLLRHRFRDSTGWELPGGFVGRHEQLEVALKRELIEETGYRVEILDLVSVSRPMGQHLDVCFSARTVNGELRLEGGEIADGRFFAWDRLPVEVSNEHRINIQRVFSKLLRRGS